MRRESKRYCGFSFVILMCCVLLGMIVTALPGLGEISAYAAQEDSGWIARWIRTDNQWSYRHADGSITKDGWEEIDHKWYYFDENGYRKTGWIVDDGHSYYLNRQGVLLTHCWVKGEDDNYYYVDDKGIRSIGKTMAPTYEHSVKEQFLFGASGALQTGWFNDTADQSDYYYLDPVYTKCFSQIDGKVYSFAQDGKMRTGMQEINGKKYFFNDQGQLTTGWIQRDETWYYFKDGMAQTGLTTINGKKYYFNSDGSMKTGWQKINGWYAYFGPTGAMKTGWIQIDDKYYYCNDYMYVDGVGKIDGKKYYFNKNGVMLTGWLYIGSEWYYFNEKGAMVTGWIKLDGVWYYLSESMVRDGRYTVDGKEYLFDRTGACLNPS